MGLFAAIGVVGFLIGNRRWRRLGHRDAHLGAARPAADILAPRRRRD
jgi:hypothetical protein